MAEWVLWLAGTGDWGPGWWDSQPWWAGSVSGQPWLNKNWGWGGGRSGTPVLKDGGSGQGLAVNGESGQGLAVDGRSGQGLAVDGGSGQGLAVDGGSGQGVAVDGGSGQGLTEVINDNEGPTNGSDEENFFCGSDLLAEAQSKWSPSKGEYASGHVHSSTEDYNRAAKKHNDQ